MAPSLPPASRLAAVVCLALLFGGILGVVAVGSVDAAPPPRPVCAACGEDFAERAAEYGVNLTVTNSTARVTVHENGTATWVVENRLADGAPLERLRTNGTLRAEIADARYWDVDVRSTSVTDDGVFTARYRDSDFARDGAGGAVLSGAFTHEYGYRNLDGLGADRLVVVAPEGMELAQVVPGGTRTADGTRLVLTAYDRGGFLTFVPQGATFGLLRGWLAIAALVGPAVVRNAAVGVLVPAAVVGTVVGLGGRVLGRLEERVSRLVDDPGRALAVAGGVGVALTLLAGAVSRAGSAGAMVFGVCVVATVAGLAWSRMTPALSFWRVTAGAIVGSAVATVATLVGSLLFAGRIYWFGLDSRLPAVLALFALVPAGYASGSGATRRGILTAVTGVVVALSLTIPLTARLWPFTLAQRLTVAVATALVLVSLGIPFLLTGALLARSGADTAGDGSL